MVVYIYMVIVTFEKVYLRKHIKYHEYDAASSEKNIYFLYLGIHTG